MGVESGALQGDGAGVKFIGGDGARRYGVVCAGSIGNVAGDLFCQLVILCHTIRSHCRISKRLAFEGPGWTTRQTGWTKGPTFPSPTHPLLSRSSPDHQPASSASPMTSTATLHRHPQIIA